MFVTHATCTYIVYTSIYILNHVYRARRRFIFCEGESCAHIDFSRTFSASDCVCSNFPFQTAHHPKRSHKRSLCLRVWHQRNHNSAAQMPFVVASEYYIYIPKVLRGGWWHLAFCLLPTISCATKHVYTYIFSPWASNA